MQEYSRYTHVLAEAAMFWYNRERKEIPMSRVVYRIEGGPVTVPVTVYGSDPEARRVLERAHRSWIAHSNAECVQAAPSEVRRQLCHRWQSHLGVRVLRYHGDAHMAAWYWWDGMLAVVIGERINRWEGEVLEEVKHGS